MWKNLIHYVDNEGKIWVERILKNTFVGTDTPDSQHKIFLFEKTAGLTRHVSDRFAELLEILMTSLILLCTWEYPSPFIEAKWEGFLVFATNTSMSMRLDHSTI